MSTEREPTSVSLWSADLRIIRKLRAALLTETEMNPNKSEMLRAGLRALDDLSVERQSELIQQARNEKV